MACYRVTFTFTFTFTFTSSTNRFDNVGPLEEPVLAPSPEREVSLAVCDQQVVVQRVKGSACQFIL